MSKRLKPVIELGEGIYVWEMPGGQWVQDTDGNVMHIPSKYGDLSRIAKLADAARYFGVEEGKPVFIDGGRAVSHNEYEYQQERAAQGLLADPYDIGALMDEVRAKNAGNK
jgi:hypothetical protein